MHNYLFVKIPLVRPQPFLDRCKLLAAILFSPLVVWSTLALGLFALALVVRRWDAFVATAVSFFSLEALRSTGSASSS